MKTAGHTGIVMVSLLFSLSLLSEAGCSDDPPPAPEGRRARERRAKAAAAPKASPAAAPDSVKRAATRPSKAGEFRGISLQLHNSSAKIPYEKYIDEIAVTGANTVSIVVSGYQENCSSTSIFIDARKVPPAGRLKGLVARAHQKKLRVVLMPILLLENPGSDEWRGNIAPTGWDLWWANYGNFICYWARLAQDAGVEVLMVGSELASTEDQAAQWRKLIARVRKIYTRGRLSYSANWDHYKTPAWWDDLDIIGMTTYHNLTGVKAPTLANILAGWRPIKKEILAWRKRINRPIIFTEVGWPNQPTCAQYPWDYYRSDKTAPAAQAACFEAFFQTWIKEPSVAGVLVWEWRNYEGRNVDPGTDTSYVPCGKPALKVIRKYFRAAGTGALSRPASRPNGKSVISNQ